MEQILETYEEEWEISLSKKEIFACVNIEDTHVRYGVC
jgi:hypothetical protein